MELTEIEFMISDLMQGLNAEFTQPRVKTSHRHKGTRIQLTLYKFSPETLTETYILSFS